MRKLIMINTARIAVVGGGIAGSSVALYLSELGLNVTLFEKGKSLVNGPPMCHLHAGGNLYREISDTQCITLLKQSIDLLRFYPFSVDYRPTVIAVPIEDKAEPKDLLPRLKRLQTEYASLITTDPDNKVLGEVDEYFKLYDKEEIALLQRRSIAEYPTTMDEWMIPVVKHIDLDKVKFPLLLVQEYGLNVFRMGAGITLAIEEIGSCELLLETKVTDIACKNGEWLVNYIQGSHAEQKSFDYLVNAAGFRSGTLDDTLGFKQERMVEFKAAYVTKWDTSNTIFPEIIFHGERGTPRGMAQFTPYPGGYFQLHGMTKEITLFDDGFSSSSKQSAQPQLPKRFVEKIERSWSPSLINERTRSAIKHIAQFVPDFKDAQVASKPLYGAQQIPGIDPELRAADVSFEGEHYARCEVVKASSVLDAIDAIVKNLIVLGYLDPSQLGERVFEVLKNLKESEIEALAKKLAQARGYPTAMAGRMISG